LTEDIKEYFERKAKEFDELYDNQGSLFQMMVNKIFRKGLYERAYITLKECGDVRGKRILDVGCGSGRISVPLAERGAVVVGIDYSLSMLNLARNFAKEREIEENIEFKDVDFMSDFNEGLFNITLALGVFDYIQNPIPFLSKMKTLTTEQILASYPARFTPQAPIRKLWLYTRKCPVYFYTKREIDRIYKAIELTSYEIIDYSAGYLVKALV
jgi:2-polyprenyl-3-methyl-5-hydroxy-6-metoxy-1,4-benzoquinol methylase